jgi:serine/threonine protein kinase
LVLELCGRRGDSEEINNDDDLIGIPSLSYDNNDPVDITSTLRPAPLNRSPSSDLFDYIKQSRGLISEDKIRIIFIQIVDAVHYLHGQGFVHRDIKDENVIIFDGDKVKLVDFGAADRIPTSQSDYFCSFRGTLRYTPPEMFTNPRHRGPQVDICKLIIG